MNKTTPASSSVVIRDLWHLVMSARPYSPGLSSNVVHIFVILCYLGCHMANLIDSVLYNVHHVLLSQGHLSPGVVIWVIIWRWSLWLFLLVLSFKLSNPVLPYEVVISDCCHLWVFTRDWYVSSCYSIWCYRPGMLSLITVCHLRLLPFDVIINVVDWFLDDTSSRFYLLLNTLFKLRARKIV
jgi:hypothetical protein